MLLRSMMIDLILEQAAQPSGLLSLLSNTTDNKLANRQITRKIMMMLKALLSLYGKSECISMRLNEVLNGD